MNLTLATKVLLLISVANSVPLFAKRVVPDTQTWHPIDGGRRLSDSQYILGPTKTIEGLVMSIIATVVAAYFLGLISLMGLIVSSGVMAGDLASSFVKRRLGLRPSSRATGLDQIPEALVPSLLAALVLPMTAGDIALIVGVFLCGEILLSWGLYQIGLREQPY